MLLAMNDTRKGGETTMELSKEQEDRLERLRRAQESFPGVPVEYVTPTRERVPALITAVHNVDEDGAPNYINLVYVETDLAKVDQYGRQIARETSVVVKSDAVSAGRYFTL